MEFCVIKKILFLLILALVAAWAVASPLTDNLESELNAASSDSTALAIIQRIWGELRQWRTTFEETGASGRLIDQLDPAMRTLSDIASPALQAEIRKTPH